MNTQRSCVDNAIAVERKLCEGMSDVWGRISKTEYLLLWWLVRHLAYGTATMALIVYVPSIMNPLVAIILIIHLYKFLRYAFYLVYDARKKKLEVGAKAKAIDESSKPSSIEDENA